MLLNSAADHAQQAADVAHDTELAKFAHRRLHGLLLGLVSDEHQPGIGRCALLLGGADADTMAGEHAGDSVQHAGLVGHLEAEQVLGTRLVDRQNCRTAERPERTVGAVGQVDRGVDDVAQNRARSG